MEKRREGDGDGDQKEDDLPGVTLFRSSPWIWGRWTPLFYRDAHNRLQFFQILMAILTLTFLSSKTEFWEVVALKPTCLTIVFLLFEFTLAMILGTAMGWEGIPANFISLLFIWAYVFYCPKEAKSSFRSSWEPWIPSTEKDLIHITVGILTCLLIGFYSRLRIGGGVLAALLANTVGTFGSTALLFYSSGIQRSPRLTSLHFRFSVLWVYLTTSVTFFNIGFLLVSLMIFLGWKRTPGDVWKKMLLEFGIWMMGIAIVVPYVTHLHPQFNPHGIFTRETAKYALFGPGYTGETTELGSGITNQ